MALPNVSITRKNNGIGIIDSLGEGVQVVLGASSLGANNTPLSFTTLEELSLNLGVGPLVEAAAFALDQGGAPVIACKVNSTGGAAGAITKSNPASPTVTVAGTSTSVYDVIVEILRTGILGTATFRFSLDGGDTYSDEITVPGGGTFLLPDTGLTLTFPAGAYTLGDKYTFVTTGPSFTLGDLNTAIDAVMDSTLRFEGLHVVGSADAALMAAVEVKLLDAANNKKRWVYAILQTRDQNAGETLTAYKTAVLTDFASVFSDHIAVVWGYGELQSPITRRVERRAMGWQTAARAIKVSISEDLGAVKRGPLGRMRLENGLYHDAKTNVDMHDAKFATARTFPNRTGEYYLTSGRIHRAAGSDFKDLQHSRIINRAARFSYEYLLQSLNDKFVVDEEGKISKEDALAVEQSLTSALQTDLISGKERHVSDVQAHVIRNPNFLITELVDVQIDVVPLGYAHQISTVIAFRNPGS